MSIRNLLHLFRYYAYQLLVVVVVALFRSSHRFARCDMITSSITFIFFSQSSQLTSKMVQPTNKPARMKNYVLKHKTANIDSSIIFLSQKQKYAGKRVKDFCSR